MMLSFLIIMPVQMPVINSVREVNEGGLICTAPGREYRACFDRSGS